MGQLLAGLSLSASGAVSLSVLSVRQEAEKEKSLCYCQGVSEGPW